MSRPRVRRAAAVLRRVADHLDPPQAAPAEAPEKLVWRSREQTREFQRQLLQMIEDWTFVVRGGGRHADGLLWFPADVLATVAYFIDHELKIRAADLAKFEQDPTVVLR